VIAYHFWRYGFWIRIFGVGVGVRRDTPSFSERNGYARIFRVGDWIVKPLGRATR
jgi:hypothetical protein